MIKIGIVSFSGRENGNCNRILQYIKEIILMNDNNLNVSLFKFSEYVISSCNKCKYECFSDKCIFQNDDIHNLYKNLFECDIIIHIVPIFGGVPCSNFFVFNERAQGAFAADSDYEKYENIKEKFIIIGNTGFDITKKIIISNNTDKYNDTDFINIRSHDVHEKSIKGNLVNYEVFKKVIYDYVNSILSDLSIENIGQSEL